MEVLDQRHAADKRQCRLDNRECGFQRLHVPLLDGCRVERFRAVLLAQSDDSHLRQAALDAAAVVGVGLHPVHDDHGIRFLCRRGDVDRKLGVTDGDGVDLIRVHPGVDGGIKARLRDTQALQHFALALGRRPAVAPHRRDDDWLEAPVANRLDDGLGDVVDTVDAAAADGDGDSRTRFQPVEVEPVEFGPRRCRRVVDGGRLRLVPDASEARQRLWVDEVVHVASVGEVHIGGSVPSHTKTGVAQLYGDRGYGHRPERSGMPTTATPRPAQSVL